MGQQRNLNTIIH